MENRGYNGWRNRETWNVALWINNDEPLYRTALAYIEERGKAAEKQKRPLVVSYSGFVRFAGLSGGRTPDHIKWISQRIDRKALTEMLREMAKEVSA